MKIMSVTTWVVSHNGLSYLSTIAEFFKYTVIIRWRIFQRYTTTDNYGKGTKNSFGIS